MEQGHLGRLESKERGCGKQQGQQATQGWTLPFRVSLLTNVSREQGVEGTVTQGAGRDTGDLLRGWGPDQEQARLIP